MATFQAFTFITSVVIVAWACIVCPPAGAVAIIYWFTASQPPGMPPGASRP